MVQPRELFAFYYPEVKRKGPAFRRPFFVPNRLQLLRRVHRQMPVGVIAVLSLISEPAIGPDLRGAQGQLAGPQDDAEGFVVEYEGQTGHGRLSVVGYQFAKASSLPEALPWATSL